MIKAVILDLDGTLIDTSALEPLRTAGRWGEVRQHLDKCILFDSVCGVVNTARAAGAKIAVFTNSPSNYAQSLLKHFNIKIDFIVAYHDVHHHKPHPEGIDKILDHFRINKDEAVYLGDSDPDSEAATRAGVRFFSVEWGTASSTDPGSVGVSKLSEYIGSRLRKTGREDATRSELVQIGNRFHLGYYLDAVKNEIWSFKDNSGAAITRWTNKSIELASSLPTVDVVVRALGHDELNVTDALDEKPLDHLARSLASKLGASYQPDALKKTRELVKSSQCSATERREQVRGAYVVNKDRVGRQEDGLTFLIVDDVHTSGATVNEISRVLSEAYPCASIYVFTLVKVLYRSEAVTASEEKQHNNQLYSDLFSPLGECGGKTSEKSEIGYQKPRKKLVSKAFSANYSKTNHNFIFHNLRPHSIAADPRSRLIFGGLQIAKNILQRGKPTIASRKLRAAFGIGVNESGLETHSQALISKKPVEWRRLIKGDKQSANYPAKRFLEELIPKYFEEYAFVKQLILPEVQIYDMTQVYVDQFQNRQVDFFIPQAGIIVEIDGPQHASSELDDASRDYFTESLGLITVRFTTQEISSENEGFLRKIEELLAHLKRIDNLETNGILQPPNGILLKDYQRAYKEGISPSDPKVRLTAAVRFQLLLIELLERGTLLFDAPQELFLLNRDKINFACDAVEDLNEILCNLFTLLGVKDKKLDLEIVEITELPVTRSSSDVIIDFSIFERYGDSFQVNPGVIYSRTHYLDFYRHFSDRDAVSMEACSLVDYDFFDLSSSDLITYDLDLGPGSKQRESLRYFLSNLFLPFIEDVDFREGQVGIIGSALSRHGTIGLLPTGSGKSVCYQLSAILQPAVSFVVCPIKSLMYDQKADLDSVGFTRSNFITSDLKADEKAKVQRDFGRGKYFFVFISPERFQTHGFRREMTAIGLDHTLAYAVIDEVHCLSEWGHDFRTSYLNLANTIEKLAPNSSYIGLTATASVNVLKDIQTEFNIPDDNVRTPLEFTREELCFHVIDDKGRKADRAVQLVAEMEAKWNGEPTGESKAGIVFTPTVNGSKGCYDLAGRLKSELDMDVRFFSGSPPKWGRMTGAAFDAYKREVQDDFKLNKYRLLTATKAFGMGVNKGNIAYTVHFGIPGSMEALYQEAGRAGRDKKLFINHPADCYVLLTKEKSTHILDKIWDSTTTVAELKAHVKTLSRESDINTNLFLMTNGLDTINDEFKLMDAIHKSLMSCVDQESVTLTARQFGSDKFKFEKAVYRLSQLGIVSDWVIEDFFNGTLQLEFACLDEDQLTYNIERTIRKYEPDFEIEDVFDSESQHYKFICNRLEKGGINRTQFIFLVLLFWSYDHFTYNRRQSLKTVYEQCSDLAAGRIGEKEFKDRLEGYFKFNESSYMLHHLAENSADTSIWLSVFYEETGEDLEQSIISERRLMTLKEQLSRFLESYKDNVCLNYLSGVVRLTSDQFSDADGERRMAASFDRLKAQDPDAAKTLVRDTVRLKPLFSQDAQRRFAKLVHEKFADFSLLEVINESFQDPFSYHQLLTPLAKRMEQLTNRYKGINW